MKFPANDSSACIHGVIEFMNRTMVWLLNIRWPIRKTCSLTNPCLEISLTSVVWTFDTSKMSMELIINFQNIRRVM